MSRRYDLSEASSPVARAISRDRRRSFRRDCCVRLLRRYFNICVELGRLPSLFGREFFRARRSSGRRPMAFEDAVIFSIDIERCLEQLDDFDRQLIARVVLQEHSEEEAARLLHCCRETISRRLPPVLDKLADTFIDRHLMVFRRRPAPETPAVTMEACAKASNPPPLGRATLRDTYATLPVEICCQAPQEGAIHASA